KQLNPQTRQLTAKELIDRRKFLSGAASIASVGALARTAAGKISGRGVEPGSEGGRSVAGLAINGGLPVRATKLRSNFPGPLYYDDEERREFLDVLDHRAPFRWYGVGPKGGSPDKCDKFEKEFAAHQGVKYCVA